MTSVTFETGVIVDAVRKTARIAPSKGNLPAAGLVLDLYPSGDVQCVARASNHAVHYSEVISALKISGDDVRWRLPSPSMAAVIGSLPIRNSHPVVMTQEGSRIRITHGRLTATVALMDNDNYPSWGAFDNSNMSMVSGLADKLSLVEWACDKDTPPLSGVYADGKYLVGCDRYKLARVPCELDIPHPILIPTGILGGILRNTGATGIAVVDGKLQVSPDDHIQVQTLLYDSKYPPLGPVTTTNYEHQVFLRKDQFLDKLNRALEFAGSDASHTLKITFGNEEAMISLENSEIGGLTDVIEIDGQAVHDEMYFNFTPRFLIDSVAKCPGDMIMIKYDDPAKGPLRAVYLSASDDFECWVFPRKRT